MTPDLINGLFEMSGAVAVLLAVRAVFRDGGYAGLSVANLVFFQTWGIWNLYFYASIDKPCSLAGGAALAFANTCYLVVLVNSSRITR